VAATAISNVDDAEPADGRSVQNSIFSDIDTQLFVHSEAAAALFDSQAHPGVTIPDELSDTALLRFREIAVRSEDRRWHAHNSGGGQGLRLLTGIAALLMAIGLGLFGNSLYHFDKRDELTGHATISAVVERINAAESSGDPNLKDTHSSATGSVNFSTIHGST